MASGDWTQGTTGKTVSFTVVLQPVGFYVEVHYLMTQPSGTTVTRTWVWPATSDETTQMQGLYTAVTSDLSTFEGVTVS